MDQCKDSLKCSNKDSLDRGNLRWVNLKLVNKWDKVDSKPNNLSSLLVAKTHTLIRTSIKI